MTLLSLATLVLSLLPNLGQAEAHYADVDVGVTIGSVGGMRPEPPAHPKVWGVNIGGWLVMEPWIKPSLFEPLPEHVVDEWTYTQFLGKQEAKQRLEQHWRTWYTEKDFADIAKAGLNAVRIPIGFWSVKPNKADPYVQGAYHYLRLAVEWAWKHHLIVMIDLHGAPVSQNGFDNSGIRGPVKWTQGDSVEQTLAVLRKIRDDFADHPAVVSIELLNEPLSSKLNFTDIQQFYHDGYRDLKDAPVRVVFHDAFQPFSNWTHFGAGMPKLILDTHPYQVFDNKQLVLDLPGHVKAACEFGEKMAAAKRPMLAGEWSAALTDCTRWLNGRGYGARFDGTLTNGEETSSFIGSCHGKYKGTVAGLTSEEKANMKEYIAAQLCAYEKGGDGWLFWTWQTESSPEWDLKALIAAGLFPQPISSHHCPC